MCDFIFIEIPNAEICQVFSMHSRKVHEVVITQVNSNNIKNSKAEQPGFHFYFPKQPEQLRQGIIQGLIHKGIQWQGIIGTQIHGLAVVLFC